VLATLAGIVINHWMVGQTNIYAIYGVGIALFCVCQYAKQQSCKSGIYSFTFEITRQSDPKAYNREDAPSITRHIQYV
jgi:hypothetical protein